MKKRDVKKCVQRINGSNNVINGRSYVIGGKIDLLFGEEKLGDDETVAETDAENKFSKTQFLSA